MESLDDFVLKKIIDSVEIETNLLIELRCFGTRLKTIIDAILRDRFCLRWNICGIAGGSPPSPTAFSTCRLCNFYLGHPVVSGESLSSIALKHQTDVSTLRRVNNIISDHTLVSRTEIFVPVQNESTLQGCNVSFQYHSAAHNRPMFVVHPAGVSAPGDGTAISDSASSDSASAAAIASTPASKYHKSNALLQQMLQKTLAIDAATAGYYLSAADGDPRAAITAYQEDQRWDAKMRRLRRSLGSKKHEKCK
ncbi:hypothetical protein Ndes2437B_g05593 [Nannochloris sp. 'desiccata']|nr:hypothetical protein KSW81_007579 [Chlorella desiccata (nom. nud.)]